MILFYGVSIYLRVLIGKHEIFYGVSISDSTSGSKRSHAIDLCVCVRVCVCVLCLHTSRHHHTTPSAFLLS